MAPLSVSLNTAEKGAAPDLVLGGADRQVGQPAFQRLCGLEVSRGSREGREAGQAQLEARGRRLLRQGGRQRRRSLHGRRRELD